MCRKAGERNNNRLLYFVSHPNKENDSFKKFPKFEIMNSIFGEELLAKQQIHFDEFKASYPQQRYLNLLQIPPDLIQGVPQHQLSIYFDIKPQSFSRLRASILNKD